jgi:hypothetical protein
VPKVTPTTNTTSSLHGYTEVVGFEEIDSLIVAATAGAASVTSKTTTTTTVANSTTTPNRKRTRSDVNSDMKNKVVKGSDSFTEVVLDEEVLTALTTTTKSEGVNEVKEVVVVSEQSVAVEKPKFIEVEAGEEEVVKMEE